MATTRSQRRASKRWRETHRDHIKDYERGRYQQRLKYMREYKRRKRQERREEIDRLFPRKCRICGTEDLNVRFHLHEIHGKQHPTDDNYSYVLKHKEDFIRVCNSCHMRIHWWMKYHKIVEGILRTAKLIKDTDTLKVINRKT